MYFASLPLEINDQLFHEACDGIRRRFAGYCDVVFVFVAACPAAVNLQLLCNEFALVRFLLRVENVYDVLRRLPVLVGLALVFDSSSCSGV